MQDYSNTQINNNLKFEYYDKLYSNSPNNILWGYSPGHLVKKINEFSKPSNFLDIGCGDGKNAIYLERLGYKIIGIDCSKIALRGLNKRFNQDGMIPKGKYILDNVRNIRLNGEFDGIISYGLFHCISKLDRIQVHRNIQEHVSIGGIIIFTCLTNNIELPPNHGTNNIELVDKNEIDKLFYNWKIEYQEEGIIKEQHLPIIGLHNHSAIWIIAKRIK